MDPLHITEFASPRYFDKLRSLNEAANNAASSSTSSSDTLVEPGQTPTSTLTLPYGLPRRKGSNAALKPGEGRKRSSGHELPAVRTQKRPSFSTSVASLRSRVTHRSSTTYADHQEEVFVEEPTTEVLTLGDLFWTLPNELQLQIIESLPLPTILALRSTCRAFHSLVSNNESSIVRYQVSQSIPAWAVNLYPLPNPADMNLHYLCGISHRLHVAAKFSTSIAEHATKEIFLRTTPIQRMEFEPQYTRMRSRLMRLVFTIFHFFEHYRKIHVEYLMSGGIPLSMLPFTENPIERRVLDMYDDDTLLRVHEVFPLVMASFSRRLRPPSYAGLIERSIKGYMRDRPANEVYATILTIGGIRQVEKFWETKGYGARRTAVDAWYGHLTRETVDNTAKAKKSLLPTLSRKKSHSQSDPSGMDGVLNHEESSCKQWYCVKPACMEARRYRSGYSSVFHTSLAAGPPMTPLPREQLRLVLADMPDFRDIWLPTGEALILERNIAENASKIKRNSQVLLDLIKDDGAAMEEEWSAGEVQQSRRRSSVVSNSGAW